MQWKRETACAAIMHVLRERGWEGEATTAMRAVGVLRRNMDSLTETDAKLARMAVDQSDRQAHGGILEAGWTALGQDALQVRHQDMPAVAVFCRHVWRRHGRRALPTAPAGGHLGMPGQVECVRARLVRVFHKGTRTIMGMRTEADQDLVWFAPEGTRVAGLELDGPLVWINVSVRKHQQHRGHPQTVVGFLGVAA